MKTVSVEPGLAYSAKAANKRDQIGTTDLA